MSLDRRSFLASGIGVMVAGATSSFVPAFASPAVTEKDVHAQTVAAKAAGADVPGLAKEANKAAVKLDDRTYGYGSLQLVREATGESIAARYRTGDQYDTRAIAELSWFWRDVNDRDQAVWVAPQLFDFISAVQATMASIHGGMLPFVLTSGFRTLAHNSQIEGAARNSQHLVGHAGDLKVPGYPPQSLAVAGMVFKGGGVGVYPKFTHLDVGDLRCWPYGCQTLVR